MRLRLILSFVLIVVVTVTSVVLIAYRQTAQEVHTFMFRGGKSGTDSIVSALENYYQTHGTWAGADVALDIARRRGINWSNPPKNIPPNIMDQLRNQRLRLADTNGKLIYDSASLIPESVMTDADKKQAIALSVNGKVVGYFLPERRFGFTPANEMDLLSRLNRAAIVAGVIAGLVALILALIVAQRLLRPVNILTEAATNLANGDMSQRVNIEGSDELTTLGETFNNMASSLQKAENSRRAMTSDIAHELRTPLAVQRAHIEALQDGIYNLTPDNLSIVEEQNLLLTRLVEDLRTLALVDTGELELECTPTDLPGLLRRVVNTFDAHATSLNVQIILKLPDSCPLLNIDPQRFEQVLHNLLDNSLRYSPTGGEIIIELECSLDQVQTTITDEGPGLPIDELPHIFERFYRTDKARNREEGGIGLGLSIARKLIQAQGGDLKAGNSAGGGAVFTIVLPKERFSQDAI